MAGDKGNNLENRSTPLLEFGALCSRTAVSVRSAVFGRFLVPTIELAVTGLIGIALAFLFWVMFAPLSLQMNAPGAAAQRSAPVLADEAINPFSQPTDGQGIEGGTRPIETIEETSLDLILYGTWTARGGGAAFIGIGDNDQKRYSVGDKITTGVKLERIENDRVTISRAGVLETLRLKNRKPIKRTGEQLNDGQRTPNVSGHETDIAGIIRLSMTDNGVGAMKMRIHPGRNLEMFEAFGFKDGDVLVAVDGAPIDKQTLTPKDVISLLTSKPSARLIVDRGGVEVPLEVDLKSIMMVDDADDDDA